METILVVGSSGNIGTSTISAALRSKRNVLAVVRNQTSADKVVKNVGTSKGITFVHADVASKDGIKRVVEQVRSGKLPAFQHVWSSVGGEYVDITLQEITDERLDYNMNVAFGANFRAYRDSLGYLLEQGRPSTFTICTGAQGERATFPLPALTQGPLFTMAVAASRENEHTNVRFNEILLAFRVEVDEVAKAHGTVTTTEFGQVYESILADQGIRGSRIRVDEVGDMKTLRHRRLF